jgi:hypothetical protein
MSAFGSGADITHSTANRVAEDCVRLVCCDLQEAQRGQRRQRVRAKRGPVTSSAPCPPTRFGKP